MGTDGAGGPGARGEQVLQVAAGLTDFALEGVENAARSLRGLLGRSDLKDLIDDGLASLAARGDLARARARATTSQAPHMEYLAQRAAERARASDA